jgi:hypothetical protein
MIDTKLLSSELDSSSEKDQITGIYKMKLNEIECLRCFDIMIIISSDFDRFLFFWSRMQIISSNKIGNNFKRRR